MSENRPWEEFAILLVVEPCAFDVEKPKTGKLRHRQRIKHELRERAVRACIGFIKVKLMAWVVAALAGFQ